jgi:hypothetical protein
LDIDRMDSLDRNHYVTRFDKISMENRPAYITPPGLSFTSVLLNMPCVMGQGPPPIIFVDKYDYDQLRKATLEGGSDSPKAPYLLTACDSLRRRNIIRIIDYAEFYTAAQQENNIRHNRELLETVPSGVNQRLAAVGDNEWIRYARGAYQESLRSGLGEDMVAFRDHRRAEKKQHRKMNRGLDDPLEWNMKVLNKGITALEVCESIQKQLNVDVQGVIASTQYNVIGELYEATQQGEQQKSPIPDFNLDQQIDADASYLDDLEPTQRIVGLDSSEAARMQDMFGTVNEIALDMPGGQHNEWTILGPILAIPHLDTMINIEFVRAKFKRENIDTLAAEAKRTISELEKVTDSRALTECQYQAEWTAEQYGIDMNGRTPHQELAATISYATDLAQWSGELMDMVRENSVSQAAAYVVASALSEPTRQYDENDTYRRSVRLRNRLNPPSIISKSLQEIQKERRGETWTEHDDWYEMLDRNR